MKATVPFLAIVGAAAVAPLVVQPSAHDFGRVVVRGSAGHSFRASVPSGVTPGGTISDTVTGPEARYFVVQSGSCTGWATGSCTYDVDFRPLHAGPFTATLVVTDSRGNRGTAALRGEGVEVIECTPELVPCNYAYAYEGKIMHESVDSTIIGKSLGQTGRWRTSLEIQVTEGEATCDGKVFSLHQTWDGNRMTGQTTEQGVIHGKGYFALEFRRSGGKLEYRMSFACPTPRLTVQFEDFIQGTVQTTVTEAEDADWRDAELAADPQPARTVLQDTLKGRQSDLRPNLGDDVGGVAVIGWELIRVK